uniref:Uncharacterized protein n=1 Tax=Rhizophora mucronata TaxID=61149 RepID=A0A2P2N507_RHIMU
MAHLWQVWTSIQHIVLLDPAPLILKCQPGTFQCSSHTFAHNISLKCCPL